MNTKDYVTIIEKTKVYPSSVDNFGIAYAFLGIIDESNEVNVVMDADGFDGIDKTALMKEIGDTIWYTTALCIELNIDTVRVLDNDGKWSSSNEMEITALAGPIKKFYRDNKPFDLEVVTNILSNFVSGAKEALSSYDISWEETLKANYDKLIKRRETNTIHGDGDYREEEQS